MDRLFRPLARMQRSDRKFSRSLQLERLEDRSLMAAIAVHDSQWSLPLSSAKHHTAVLIGPAVTALKGSASALTDDGYENNDTQALAKNLGTIQGGRSITGLVMADSADWFRFTTTATGGTSDAVTLSFTHSQGDLDIYLYNSSGQSLTGSTGVTGSERISLSGRAAGTYFVRVYGYRGVTNPGYTLGISASTTPTPPPTPTDDAYENNDTSATASSLGTLTATRTVSALRMADAADWFSFTMNAAGTSSNYARISFTHSQGDLDLEVYNSSGTRVGASTSTSGIEQVSLSGLPAGTYRVRVYGYQGALNPNYTLDISPGVATTPPTPPPTTGNFNIQFRFSGLTAAQQQIFQTAAAKWQSVITGDLPAATYNGIAVDDILIDASAVAIDGVGSVLGQAGPDRFRSGTSLPYHGTMQFDSADMTSMINNGTFLGVILHEMGHVLGVGTLWSSKGLLSGSGGSNPIFTGPRATAEYNALFGTNASGVPVENTGGSGTRNAHWRETVFSSELMTGWIGPGNSLPMSRITIASLADMGYTVNMAAADPYTPPGSSSFQSGSSGGGSGSNVLAGMTQLPEIEPLHIHRRRWEAAVDAVFASGRGLFD